MFLVGLTGGIASGKSTVSAMLEAHGAEVIDADIIAREVVEPGTAGLESIVQVFGKEILNTDGTLSRAKLASLVFGSQEERLKLESILHPMIKDRVMQLIRSSSARVVIYVVPLLVEARVDYPFDLVVTVESGVETQVKRLIETRGLNTQEAKGRIQAQATEQQRVARADVRLDGSSTIADLEKDVSKLWERILSLAEKKAEDGEN